MYLELYDHYKLTLDKIAVTITLVINTEFKHPDKTKSAVQARSVTSKLQIQNQNSVLPIIKTVAIRRQILRLKCTEFDLGWSSAPDPAGPGGAYSTPSDPLAGFYC